MISKSFLSLFLSNIRFHGIQRFANEIVEITHVEYGDKERINNELEPLDDDHFPI